MGGGVSGGKRPRALLVAFGVACVWTLQVAAWSPEGSQYPNHMAPQHRDKPRGVEDENVFLQVELNTEDESIEKGGKRVFANQWEMVKERMSTLVSEKFKEVEQDQVKYEASILNLEVTDNREARQSALEYRVIASSYLDLPWVDRVVADPVCMHAMLHDEKMAVANSFRPIKGSEVSSDVTLSLTQAVNSLVGSVDDRCTVDEAIVSEFPGTVNPGELENLGEACGMPNLQLFWCMGSELQKVSSSGFSSSSGKSMFFAVDTKTFHAVHSITSWKVPEAVTGSEIISGHGLDGYYSGLRALLDDMELEAYFSEASTRYPSWAEALSQFPVLDGLVLTAKEMEQKFSTMEYTDPDRDQIDRALGSSVIFAVKAASSGNKLKVYLDHVTNTSGSLGVPDMAIFDLIAIAFKLQLHLHVYDGVSGNLRSMTFGDSSKASSKLEAHILGIEPLGREFYGLHGTGEGKLPVGVIKRTVRRRLLSRYDVENVDSMLANYEGDWSKFQDQHLHSLNVDDLFNSDNVEKRGSFAPLQAAIDGVGMTNCPCCANMGEETGSLPNLENLYDMNADRIDKFMTREDFDELRLLEIMKTDACVRQAMRPIMCGQESYRTSHESIPDGDWHVQAMLKGRAIHVFECVGVKKELKKSVYQTGAVTNKPLVVFQESGPSARVVHVRRIGEDDGTDKNKQYPQYAMTKCNIEIGVAKEGDDDYPGYKYFQQTDGADAPQPVASHNFFRDLKRCFMFEVAVGALVYGNANLLDKLVYLEDEKDSIFGDDYSRWTNQWYADYLQGFNTEKQYLTDGRGRNLLYFVPSSIEKDQRQEIFYRLLLGPKNTFGPDIVDTMLCHVDEYRRTPLQHYNFYGAEETANALKDAAAELAGSHEATRARINECFKET